VHINILTHKSDHENSSASHDHLVTVPSDQVTSELESEDLSDIGTIGNYIVSACEDKLRTCSLPRSSDGGCTINDLIPKSVVERG